MTKVPIIPNREIVFVGGGLVIGGSINKLPPYYDVIAKILRSINRNAVEWDGWWRKSGAPQCQVFAWVGGPATKVRVHRSERRVLAQIDRVIPVRASGWSDPGKEAAISDAHELIDRLADRFDLGKAPTLVIPPERKC